MAFFRQAIEVVGSPEKVIRYCTKEIATEATGAQIDMIASIPGEKWKGATAPIRVFNEYETRINQGEPPLSWQEVHYIHGRVNELRVMIDATRGIPTDPVKHKFASAKAEIRRRYGRRPHR